MGFAYRGRLAGGYGAGAVLVAAFPTERIDRPEDVWVQTTTGMIHVTVSLISFVAMITAMFILFRTFLLNARWRADALDRPPALRIPFVHARAGRRTPRRALAAAPAQRDQCLGSHRG